MIKYSRVGLPYGVYKKGEKKQLKKPNSIDYVNCVLFGLLFLVIVLFLLS